MSGEFDLESVYKLQLCRMNIRTIENLENCTNLQELNLSGNDIERIEGLERLHNLRKITLTTNKITSLAGLDKCENLEHILIQENNVGNIGEFTQLLGLKNLKSLYFKNIDGTQRNPLCEHPSYRSSIVRQLTQLTILDGERLKHANTVYSDAPAAPSSAPAVVIPESKAWLGDFSWDDDGGGSGEEKRKCKAFTVALTIAIAIAVVGAGAGAGAGAVAITPNNAPPSPLPVDIDQTLSKVQSKFDSVYQDSKKLNSAAISLLSHYQ